MRMRDGHTLGVWFYNTSTLRQTHRHVLDNQPLLTSLLTLQRIPNRDFIAPVAARRTVQLRVAWLRVGVSHVCAHYGAVLNSVQLNPAG